MENKEDKIGEKFFALFLHVIIGSNEFQFIMKRYSFIFFVVFFFCSVNEKLYLPNYFQFSFIHK